MRWEPSGASPRLPGGPAVAGGGRSPCGARSLRGFPAGPGIQAGLPLPLPAARSVSLLPPFHTRSPAPPADPWACSPGGLLRVRAAL